VQLASRRRWTPPPSRVSIPPRHRPRLQLLFGSSLAIATQRGGEVGWIRRWDGRPRVRSNRPSPMPYPPGDGGNRRGRKQASEHVRASSGGRCSKWPSARDGLSSLRPDAVLAGPSADARGQRFRYQSIGDFDFVTIEPQRADRGGHARCDGLGHAFLVQLP
jgi:hypothetical protein